MFRNYGFHCLLLICSLQHSMGSQYREVWRNNPDKHIKGVTFEKLQEVIQKYPVTYKNGMKMDDGGSISGFVEETDDMRAYVGDYTIKTKPCRSFLNNCDSLQKIGSWKYCVSARNDRRYDFLEFGKFVFGRDYGQCFLSQKFTSPYAVCDCESQERKIDRYFSLIHVMADEDKVVTGVRLKKDNHVFHIQIQQGKLGPFGSIEGEVTWKDIRTISTSELLSKEISKYVEISSGLLVKYYKHLLVFLKNPIIYAITSQQNTVLLDDVVADNGLEEVVTGLGFRQVDNDLRLEIQLTPFDYATGKLEKNTSRWEYKKVDKSQRKLVHLARPDDPSLHNGTANVISANDKYIQFRPSDFEKDLGQTTVPFIDVQDVVVEKPSPLIGVGIIHKGSEDSAGFIALKGIYYKRPDVLVS